MAVNADAKKKLNIETVFTSMEILLYSGNRQLPREQEQPVRRVSTRTRKNRDRAFTTMNVGLCIVFALAMLAAGFYSCWIYNFTIHYLPTVLNIFPNWKSQLNDLKLQMMKIIVE